MAEPRYTNIRRGLIALAIVVCVGSPNVASMANAQNAPPPTRNTDALSPQEFVQAKKLAVKIAAVVAAMPAGSSQKDIEGAVLGVTAGVACKIVRAAIAMDAPSLRGPAKAAVAAVAKACGPIGAVGQNSDAIEPGVTPGGGGVNGPGFTGGGGPNYSQ